MKNVSISLSTVTYKRHINNVVCTKYDDLCAVPVSVKCLLDKYIFPTKEMHHVKSKLHLNV